MTGSIATAENIYCTTCVQNYLLCVPGSVSSSKESQRCLLEGIQYDIYRIAGLHGARLPTDQQR